MINVYAGTKYTKYDGEERPHKSGKRLYPCVIKSFKTQHCRILMDPAILAAIGHCFIAKQKKILNADARVRGNARGDQKLET